MNKVALVTGASLGIGKAVSLEFAKQNITVIMADKNEVGQETCDYINNNGGKSVFFKCDVSKENDLKDLIGFAGNEFSRLDFAANIAGIMQQPTPLIDMDEENWDLLVNNNMKSIWLSMKAEIPYMIKQGHGTIVNMASLAGVKIIAGLGPYSATKAAIIMMSKTAAKEYAQYNIRVNSISPGVTMTDVAINMSKEHPEYFQNEILSIIPQKRAATPDEIAKSIVWLCNENSLHITGHNLVVDGGALL